MYTKVTLKYKSAIFTALGKNQDAVQVHEVVEHFAEVIINKHLEDGRHFGKTKWHDQAFVVATGGVERLLLVALADMHQVVGVPQV